MNEKGNFPSIEERELQSALSHWRVDPVEFEHSVRKRVLAGKPQSTTRSPWTAIAASVVPLPLLSQSALSAPTTLAKIGALERLIGYLAIPAIGLLLVAGATAIGLFHIGLAQRHPAKENANPGELFGLVAHWWRRYGWMMAAFSLLALALQLTGFTLPLMLAILVSGCTMAALVIQLGRAGLLDRRIVGSHVLTSLLMLAQLIPVFTLRDAGVHLLDQELIQVALLIAAALGAIYLVIDKQVPALTEKRSVTIFVLGATILGAALWSLAQPVSDSSLRRHVESFRVAKFHTASWNLWSIPASWLHESGITVDLSQPRQLLLQELQNKPNPFVLANAFESGLMTSRELSLLGNLADSKARLLDENAAHLPLPSVEQVYYKIAALATLNQLTQSDQDLLEARLLMTLRTQLEREDLTSLRSLLAASKSLEAINRPCRDDAIQAGIQKLLVSLQRLQPQIGGGTGGFAASPKLHHADLVATSEGVELMQRYGLPGELKVMPLRSFLRPSLIDMVSSYHAAARAATLRRLEKLPGVPPLTYWDYLQCEANLWMTLMLVTMSFVAVLGSRSTN